MELANQTQVKWSMQDTTKVLLTIFCLLVGMNIVFYLIDLKRIFSESAHPSVITTIAFLIQNLVFLCPIFFLVVKKYKLKPEALGFRNIGVINTLKWVAKGFGLVVVFNIFFNSVILRFVNEVPGFLTQESHIPLFGEAAPDIILAIIVLVIVAPIVEETLFRGFILQSFLARFGPKTASTISAVIFALMHFEFQSIGKILVLGLILNWLFMRTKSIWPGIGFHVLNNAVALLAEFLLK